MTYEQTIEYLYNLLPVFHRTGAKAYKANLDNTIALCNYLGNPEKKLKCIHVGGTNGKGSTSHFLSAILQSQGYKTALYTSPHLKDFTERFRINGVSIDKANIIAFVAKHKEFIERLKPSFFELSVALAFDYFASENVDYAVIEVGLGGRLDSTNVIKPILSIITNIGFDHTDILGDTLEKIAFEKAGIIKHSIPVVIGETTPETKKVFLESAKTNLSEIFFSEELLTVIDLQTHPFELTVSVCNSHNDTLFEKLNSQLIGKYQIKNIRTVLAAIDVLNHLGISIDKNSVENGISNVVSLTGLKGRFQILNKSPLTIADTAHNEHGIKEVLLHINSMSFTKKYFILGFMKDKDILSILQLFPKDAEFCFCKPDSPRAESPENLIKIANSINISGYSILSVHEAVNFLTQKASDSDLIYIGGSTFVVAEL